VWEKNCKIGWGATCGRHENTADVILDKHLQCKKMITFGKEQFSDDECVSKLKHWLLAGFDIHPGMVTARTAHVGLDARSFPSTSDGLDERLQRLRRATQ